MKTGNKARIEGSAFAITMLVILVAAACIGTAVHVTTTSVRQTDSSRDFATLRNAAEGALDFAYGVWVEKINTAYGPVSNKALSQALATIPSFATSNGVQPSYDSTAGYSGPQITGIDLSNFGKPIGDVNSNTMPPSIQIPLIDNTGRNKYPGWLGKNTSYLASVRMSAKFLGGRSVSYGVKRAINYTTVPLFQATAFFEDTLELYRPATMTIEGLVHTNSDAAVSQGTNNGNTLTFTGNLSYVTGYLDNTAPYPADDPTWRASHSPTTDWWSGYVANAAFPPNYPTGFDQQVTQVTRMEPLGTDAATILAATPPPYNVSTNHNADSARELIEPPNTYVDPITHVITTTNSFTDPQLIADRRMYNKAGIRIRVTRSGSTTTYTITTANGATLTAAQKTALTNSLSQQTVYDRREATNVDVTSMDLSAARATLSNSTTKFNGILYIDDVSSTGYSDPKAIRLTNGATLPSIGTTGLTVASQNPVYIQGDYNTSGTRVPSAVFADSVTILSNAWNDSNSSGGLSSRVASDTTVNTALVCGFTPSEWSNPVTHETYGYSGGLNNFPRFLEDWNNKAFTYKGSMIELFASGIATGQWDTGSIYHPPDRAWSFDSNFVDNPPPGSLTAVSVSRGAFVRF